MTQLDFLSSKAGGLPLTSAPDASGSQIATQIIKFALGDDQYGVNIMSVREIKEWSTVNQLPEQPDYVRGVLDLRGAMVPIVDLRCRFGQGVTEPTPTHIVIIVMIDDQLVGLLGDRVLDIVEFEAGEIKPVPQVSADSTVGFLSGLVTVDGTMIALIDLSRLLSGKIDDSATARGFLDA